MPVIARIPGIKAVPRFASDTRIVNEQPIQRIGHRIPSRLPSQELERLRLHRWRGVGEQMTSFGMPRAVKIGEGGEACSAGRTPQSGCTLPGLFGT